MSQSFKINLNSRVDKALDAAIEEKRVIGAVVLISVDGELVYSRAAGMANRELNVAMREDAIFLLSSVTKPIVAIAALRLVEQGRIDLDDPVTRWLPDFTPRLADGGKVVIRVRHLLTHTSGLGYGLNEDEDGPYFRAGVSDGLDRPGMDLSDNLRRIASVPLSFAPGDGWRYSVSMDVLGAIIEKETGATLANVVEQLVTSPLGLMDTGFTVKDRARLATVYTDGAIEPILMAAEAAIKTSSGTIRYAPNRIFDPASYQSGGTGMAGTARDILAVLECVRQGGHPLLSQRTVKTMLVDQSRGRSGVVRPALGFGFGWSVVCDPMAAGLPLSAGSIHWGGVYGHTWFVDPARKMSVVALTNTATEGVFGRFPSEIKNAACQSLSVVR